MGMYVKLIQSQPSPSAYSHPRTPSLPPRSAPLLTYSFFGIEIRRTTALPQLRPCPWWNSQVFYHQLQDSIYISLSLLTISLPIQVLFSKCTSGYFVYSFLRSVSTIAAFLLLSSSRLPYIRIPSIVGSTSTPCAAQMHEPTLFIDIIALPKQRQTLLHLLPPRSRLTPLLTQGSLNRKLRWGVQPGADRA